MGGVSISVTHALAMPFFLQAGQPEVEPDDANGTSANESLNAQWFCSCSYSRHAFQCSAKNAWADHATNCTCRWSGRSSTSDFAWDTRTTKCARHWANCGSTSDNARCSSCTIVD